MPIWMLDLATGANMIRTFWHVEFGHTQAEMLAEDLIGQLGRDLLSTLTFFDAGQGKFLQKMDFTLSPIPVFRGTDILFEVTGAGR